MKTANHVPCKKCAELENTIRALRGDVAYRCREERALRETLKVSEEIFRGMLEGFFVCQYHDPGELFCVNANPEAGRLMGVGTEECLGAEFDEIWPNARSQGLTDALLRTVQTGEAFSTEEAYWRKGAVDRLFRLRVFPLSGKRVCVALEEVGEDRKQASGKPKSSDAGLAGTDETTADLRSRIKELEDELARLHAAEL